MWEAHYLHYMCEYQNNVKSQQYSVFSTQECFKICVSLIYLSK